MREGNRWGVGRIKWDATMAAGATPSTDDLHLWLDGDDPGGTPFVAIADMSRRERVTSTAKSLSPEGLASRGMPIGEPGTLLFAMYASVGEVAFLDRRATWNQALLGITPNPEKVDSRFLRYVLLDMKDELLREVRSNTQANLNAGQVGNIWFQRPKVEEQRAIADYLDRETARIDALIEEQQRLIEILRERRSATLDRIVLSVSAETAPLRHLVELITVGIVVQPAQWYVDAGVLALRGLNIRPERLDLRDVVHISDEGHVLHQKTALKAGDVVIVRTGQAGAAAVIPPELDGANAIDVLIVRPGPALDGEFLAMALNAPITREASSQAAVGTIQSHLNVSALRGLSVGRMPVEAQRKAVAEWREQSTKLDELIEETERFIELSSERRAALITAAVTGEIDVREVA